jgi:sulfatase maturation enzyme AslB (radical SAM superfamily)
MKNDVEIHSATVVRLPRRSMTTMSMEEVAQYFNRVAFLFVPNVCNARCRFCYVAPGFANNAHLPLELLARGSNLFDALSEWGFEEVRVTGGEPLLFDNVGGLFADITSSGLRYRVLTNGLNLSTFLPDVHRNPPCQFTVSIHSLERISEIYQVPIDIDSFVAGVSDATRVASVECTLVVEHDEDVASFDYTLSRLRDCGVTGIKVILANVPTADEHTQNFVQLATELRSQWSNSFDTFRTSDVEDDTCHLRAKGFLSVELSSLRAYACCVQVGSSPDILGAHYSQLGSGTPLRIDLGEDGRRLSELALGGKLTSGLPCDAYYGACPIAIR